MRSSRSENGITYWTIKADKVLLMNRRENKDNGESKVSSRRRNKDSDYPIYVPNDELENLR